MMSTNAAGHGAEREHDQRRRLGGALHGIGGAAPRRHDVGADNEQRAGEDESRTGQRGVVRDEQPAEPAEQADEQEGARAGEMLVRPARMPRALAFDAHGQANQPRHRKPGGGIECFRKDGRRHAGLRRGAV